MTRKEILDKALQMVSGARQDDYGEPEDSFQVIADLWTAYIGDEHVRITPKGVAAMMALLKIARIRTGHGKSDNWVDLAGYAACGGEIDTARKGDEE